MPSASGDHEQDLAGLEPDEAVDDVRLFEHPLAARLLVEASVDERDHLFSGFRRLDQ
jgi:hypothetical protein